MKKTWFCLLAVMALAVMPIACSRFHADAGRLAGKDASAPGQGASGRVLRAIQGVKSQYAPDPHLAIFNIGVQSQGQTTVVTGEVSEASAKLEVVQAIERAGVKAIE